MDSGRRERIMEKSEWYPFIIIVAKQIFFPYKALNLWYFAIATKMKKKKNI